MSFFMLQIKRDLGWRPVECRPVLDALTFQNTMEPWTMTHKIDRSNYLKLSEDGFAMDLKLTHLQRHDFNPLGRPLVLLF